MSILDGETHEVLGQTPYVLTALDAETSIKIADGAKVIAFWQPAIPRESHAH